MKVTVLYFAALRETLGRDRESLDLPAGVATAGSLRDWLRGRGGAWAEQLDARRTVRIAIDQSMAKPDTPIRDGAEVAFFPPVTGG
jgi:sulfur-carrier protein